MTDRLVLSSLTIQSGDQTLVRDVGIDWRAGQILALVGPSGAGKTLTARSLLGMVNARPGVTSAHLMLRHRGKKHHPYGPLPATPRQLDAAFAPIRGRAIAYLPQDASGSLDPTQRVRGQLLAAGCPTTQIAKMLSRAGLNDESVGHKWPHQLSGGMAQRVALAMVMARRPAFLIVDEPATGLDTVARAAVLAELARLAREGVGIMVITHDLRILPSFADHVLVMSGGAVVEELPGPEIGSATSVPGARLVAATRRVTRGGLS